MTWGVMLMPGSWAAGWAVRRNAVVWPLQSGAVTATWVRVTSTSSSGKPSAPDDAASRSPWSAASTIASETTATPVSCLPNRTPEPRGSERTRQVASP